MGSHFDGGDFVPLPFVPAWLMSLTFAKHREMIPFSGVCRSVQADAIKRRTHLENENEELRQRRQRFAVSQIRLPAKYKL